NVSAATAARAASPKVKVRPMRVTYSVYVDRGTCLSTREHPWITSGRLARTSLRVRRRPDTELITLARGGSTDAAAALFDRSWVQHGRAAYAGTAARALADDAAQDAIQQAFGALRRFDETRPFGPWLKRIAVNRAIDQLRKTNRLTSLEDDHATLHAWSLGEGAEDDLRLWGIADAVAALGHAKRVVVVLHYWL